MSNAIETAKFLRRYQSWRKGEIDVFYPDSHAGPNPVEISAAIDRAIAALEAQPPCGTDWAVRDVAALASAVRDIPDRIKALGGQRFAYVKLSEVIDTIYAHASQPAAPVAPATVAVPETDAVCAAMDRQYLAGLQAGWGLGSLNDRDGYTAAQNARRNDLALLASQPAAPVARSLSESFDKVMAMQDPKDIPDDAITLESCDRARRLMTDLGYATDDSRDPLAQDFKTRLIAKHFMRAMEAAPVAPATVAVPVPDGVVVAFGLLWHVRMGCDFPVPEGFSRNISPEEAAAKARRFLAGLLTREQRGEGINRAAAILSTTDTEVKK